MQRISIPLLTILGAAFALAASSPVQATIIYGSLSNFDCINDTGTTAHGFEIELDGTSPADILATFGDPYNRYGTPIITSSGGNTYVRYEATYSNGVWSAGTDSGTYSPTDGHSLFYPQYGGTASYPNVPGDHFGIATSNTPTNTVYHWLLDDGTGNLVLAGTTVKVPAPILTVAPPANPVNQAAVQAVIQAPAPENGQEFGDAIWAKVFTTEVENPDPVELGDLVLGNPVVPPETETEIEWVLLQTSINGGANSELTNESDVGNGNESVTRRYEFYAYTGAYDPENHEALSDTYDPSIVGDFLGNQNVAVNFVADVVGVPEPGSLLLVGLGAFGMIAGAIRRRPVHADF